MSRTGRGTGTVSERTQKALSSAEPPTGHRKQPPLSSALGTRAETSGADGLSGKQGGVAVPGRASHTATTLTATHGGSVSPHSAGQPGPDAGGSSATSSCKRTSGGVPATRFFCPTHKTEKAEGARPQLCLWKHPAAVFNLRLICLKRTLTLFQEGDQGVYVGKQEVK